MSQITFYICCFVDSSHQAYRHYLQFQIIKYFRFKFLSHQKFSSCFPLFKTSQTFSTSYIYALSLSLSQKKQTKSEYQNKQPRPIKQHQKIVKMEITPQNKIEFILCWSTTPGHGACSRMWLIDPGTVC